MSDMIARLEIQVCSNLEWKYCHLRGRERESITTAHMTSGTIREMKLAKEATATGAALEIPQRGHIAKHCLRRRHDMVSPQGVP